jgi:small subunit ribosomal protein S17
MITKQGIVTSAKMKNTVTVTVHRHAVHPLYKKRYRVSKKFMADTNGQTVGEGDEVLIAECRPLSKLKHFKVMEILKKAPKTVEMKEDAVLESVLKKNAKKEESSSSSKP